MKILVIGNGAREHALLWKLRRDAPEASFHIAPGNGGTGELAAPVPVDAADVGALVNWAAGERIDLTVVGPEVPLAAGVVDRFETAGLPIFGPRQEAAEIESSKAFAKGLMRRHGIPTADFEVFSEAVAAREYVRRLGAPVVVKASGLAAGKGALVCESTAAALRAVEEILTQRAFGAAGERVVIEEFMEGEELSVFAISDGENLLVLLPAQDHKRIGEGDTGPNTGGMGAYAPVAIATPELLEQVTREILEPTIRALAQEGRAYRGFLYAGLMLTPSGPRVVEFNCRFGDPEAQVVLPLLESSLLEPLQAVASGERLPSTGARLRWRAAAAVTTVLASGGYPAEYRTGLPIHIPPSLRDEPDVLVFHAGTAQRQGQLVTAGGRVISVTGIAPAVEHAAARSREAADRIEFEGRTFRSDIGWREIARRSSASAPPGPRAP